MIETKDLPAGRELDALVAEKVMGWTFQTFPEGACPEVRHWHRTSPIPEERSPEWAASFIGACPRYSTDIAAAWTVVLRLFDLEAWDAILLSATSCDPYFDRDQLDHADGDTAAHAICRAALKAISGSTPGTP